ncbi:hypothetical protein F5X97DRAFT_304548 [Nemania serpens]|nr:hypothetical protein F5X97DRAFT_304548 [Nemania serpens]
MLAEIHEKIHKLHHLGFQQTALEQALDYACTWGFVTGYKVVFDARTGIFTENSEHIHLAVFMSFTGINKSSTAAPQHTTSTGGTSSMDSTSEQPRPENASTAAIGGTRERKAVSSLTKSWVVGRILHLMLRCYGSTSFPKELWFMEESGDDRPPSLLLPYSLSVRSCENLVKRSVKARRRILNQIELSNASAEERSMTDVGGEEAIMEEEDE